jgi:hypothetical protein
VEHHGRATGGRRRDRRYSGPASLNEFVLLLLAGLGGAVLALILGMAGGSVAVYALRSESITRQQVVAGTVNWVLGLGLLAGVAVAVRASSELVLAGLLCGALCGARFSLLAAAQLPDAIRSNPKTLAAYAAHTRQLPQWQTLVGDRIDGIVTEFVAWSALTASIVELAWYRPPAVIPAVIVAASALGVAAYLAGRRRKAASLAVTVAAATAVLAAAVVLS